MTVTKRTREQEEKMTEQTECTCGVIPIEYRDGSGRIVRIEKKYQCQACVDALWEEAKEYLRDANGRLPWEVERPVE